MGGGYRVYGRVGEWFNGRGFRSAVFLVGRELWWWLLFGGDCGDFGSRVYKRDRRVILGEV